MGKIFKALEKTLDQTDDGNSSGSNTDRREIAGLFENIDYGLSVELPIADECEKVIEEFESSDRTISAHNDKDKLNESGLSVDQNTQDVSVNTYSIVPQIEKKLSESIIAHYKPHSFESEQFRLLKTSILFPENGSPPRTIMVTSTAQGEGKSFVASNLAVTIANSIDEYVLLIDCSLRNPSIHSNFGFPLNTPGLSEYLANKLKLSSVLHKSTIDKLTIIPCGVPPENPSELISSDQMRQLLAEVKERYDDRYIILDSPPPYVTSEANALARLVDTIIMVVQTGKTRMDNLKDLVDTYGKDKIIGIVKNFDQPSFFSKTKYKYIYTQ